MENFNFKKYLAEGKLTENSNSELIDRIEGIANTRDLKTLHDMLRMLSTEWMGEGFEKEDIIEYLAAFVDNI